MRFKLDENLPSELAFDLIRLGHEAHTVFDEGLSGADDPAVLAAAHNERRVLLTLDRGFASILDYPPEKFSGIVLFRLDGSGRRAVRRFILERLPDVLALDPTGRLVVVGVSRIRIR